MNESTNRWQKLKEVFNEVGELAPDVRQEYLSKLRLNEKTLFEEVSELLEAEKDSAEFLQKPLVFEADYSFIGETVGHYRIVREIGRGGMGAVFEAVREDGEFDQKAAVKLTNRNLFSDELIKRFRTERQILARLEHKNIVRLLDGGITANQIPYFVMEFVEGVSVTEFCAENNLGIDERLALFLQVCEAVSYAHRRLIVHRDLKPSNILVTKNGEVKLLDFGIAKILDADEQTQTANAPLTPEYASPEQIKGETITTAADIYSLGVILYELLTEKSPAEIYGVERNDLLRGVCESEPIRPSLATRGQSNAKTRSEETNRKSQIANRKSLKGDLDNIILKSLQKEKEQRYASVEQFADDIKAYLQGLPVKAHPQSFAYRARKFVKRNRLAVSIASASVLLILAVAGIAVWQAFVAQKQKQIAEQNFNQVRKIANSLILDYHDEIAKLEGSTKLREKLVTDALEYLDAISPEETDNAELLKEMAIAYRKIGTVQGMAYAANLGKTDEAVKNHEKSVALLEKAITLEPKNLSLKDELVKSYSEMAQSDGREGKSQYETYKKAIAINDDLVRQDAENLPRKIYGLRLKVFAADSSKQEHFERIEDYQKIISEAENLFSQHPENIDLVAVLAITTERIGSRYREFGFENRKKGLTDVAQNAFLRGKEFSEKSLQYMTLRQKLNPNDANNKRRLFVANSNLCLILLYLKKTDEAEKYLQVSEEIVEQMKKKDPDNKETVLDEIVILENKVEFLILKGQLENAFQNAGKAVELGESYLKTNPNNGEAIHWVGYFQTQLLRIREKQGNKKGIEIQRQHLENFKVRYRKQFNAEPGFSGIGI